MACHIVETGNESHRFASNQRVACHAVSLVRGGFTTSADHMPASHRAHLEWSPANGEVIPPSPAPNRAPRQRVSG